MATDVSSGRMQDTAGALAECDALEVELAELRAAYEQYFSGIERIAPLKRHDALKKRFKKLKSSFIRQTATKFRINSLHAKYLTYERQWEKTLQQREDGTYRPDLERARRRAQRLQGAAASGAGRKDGPGRQAVELDLAEDVSLDDFDFSEFDAPKPAPPPAAPAVEDEFDALLSSLTEAPTPAPPPRTASPTPSGAGARPASQSQTSAPPAAPAQPSMPGAVASTGSVTGTRPTSGAVPAVARPGGTVAPATTRTASGSVPAVGAGARPSSGSVPAVPAPGAQRTVAAATARPVTGGVPAVGGSRPSSGAVPAVPRAGAAGAAAPATTRTVSGSVPAVGAAPRPSSGAVPAVTRPGAVGSVAPATTRPATGGVPAVGAAARPPSAARPATPAGTSSAPRPVSTSASAVTDAKLRAVYDAYVNAKRRCNEDVSKLSFERVSSELRQEVGAVTQRSGAKSVEFKVVIKDGRAELRTLPKD